MVSSCLKEASINRANPSSTARARPTCRRTPGDSVTSHGGACGGSWGQGHTMGQMAVYEGPILTDMGDGAPLLSWGSQGWVGSSNGKVSLNSECGAPGTPEHSGSQEQGGWSYGLQVAFRRRREGRPSGGARPRGELSLYKERAKRSRTPGCRGPREGRLPEHPGRSRFQKKDQKTKSLG